MKKIKKILAAVMTLAMVLGMSMTTFAAALPVDPAITSKVTLTGLSSNVPTTVNVYQFASLLYDEDRNEYSWNIADWATNVTLNQNKDAYVVADYDDLKDLAVETEPLISLTGDDAVEGTSVELTLPIGAYVIVADDTESTYGTLIANTYDRDNTPTDLNQPATVENQVIVAKAEEHKITKEASDSFVQVGTDVDFTLTTTFPSFKNADGTETLSEFVVTDTPNGLAIDEESVEVTIGSTTVYPGVSVGQNGALTVNFSNIISESYAGQLVTIKYTAEVTSTTYNNTASAESNLVTYNPGNTEGKSGGIVLTKVDAEKTSVKLTGAEFSVYDLGDNDQWDSSNKGTAMPFVYDETLNAYRPAVSTDSSEKITSTVAVDNNGQLTIVGLDEGKYHFEETKAPNGYSINEAGLDVTVTDEVTTNVSENFLDTKLASLPSTGGIGTTIFTIGGCIIMIAAAGLFFASRRKSSK